MLYPAELQALLQPRGVRLAQDFNLCLAQDAEKSRQQRSRIAQRLNVPARGVRLPRSCSLRPCWTSLLSILCGSSETRDDGREKRDRKFEVLNTSAFRLSHLSRAARIHRAGILLLLPFRYVGEALLGPMLPPVPGDLLLVEMRKGAAESG